MAAVILNRGARIEHVVLTGDRVQCRRSVLRLVPETRSDDLAPARGALLGVLLGAACWVVGVICYLLAMPGVRS